MRWDSRTEMSSAIWMRKSLILSYLTGGDIGSIDKMVTTCGQRGRHCYTILFSTRSPFLLFPPYFPPNGPQRCRGVECQYQRCRWGIVVAIITIVVLARHYRYWHSRAMPPRTRLSRFRCAVLRSDATCDPHRATLRR